MADAQQVGVIGAGAWGTTLAALAAANGHRAVVLGRDAETMAAFNAASRNLAYLSSFALPHGLHFTADPAEALAGSDAVILAVPSHHLRDCLTLHREFLSDPALPICSSVKGFMDDRLTRVAEALPECIGAHPVAVLSGPNLAKEVLKGDPTVTVIAANQEQPVDVFRELLARPTFRVYGSHDVAGVEIGGAVKNILALAAGITTGLGFGMNTQAALLSRGLAEMVVLGTHLGAQKETLMGIAGLGDAVCTCLSPLSRNVQVGRMLGEGASLQTAIDAASGVAEGVETAAHVAAYASANGLDLPITQGVARILDGTRKPLETLGLLMDRAWKMEAQ